MEESPAESAGGFKQTLKDLTSGAAGGVAQVLIGQPFDIVKVRLQTTQQYSGAFDAAKKIYTNEGPLAFYKGTLTPLIGIGACVSIQFGAFNMARRFFERRNARDEFTNHPMSTLAETPFRQNFMAGAFAGVANSVLSGPIEHVRIRLQTQPHDPSKRLYTGPLDCARKLIAQNGWLEGLYRGQVPTMYREVLAYGSWFGTFEYLMQRDARVNEIRRDQISPLKVAFYGGLAGEVLWLASYPLDVIKSKMQSDGFGDKMRYTGMRDCWRQTFESEWYFGMLRGIGPTLLRAMPVSAGTFAVVELTMRLLNGQVTES